MAAVRGLETGLRVAGAAAARPERFLRYCGAAGVPGAGEPTDAGPGASADPALGDSGGPRYAGGEAACPSAAPVRGGSPGARPIWGFCRRCCSVLCLSSAFGNWARNVSVSISYVEPFIGNSRETTEGDYANIEAEE